MTTHHHHRATLLIFVLHVLHTFARSGCCYAIGESPEEAGIGAEERTQLGDAGRSLPLGNLRGVAPLERRQLSPTLKIRVVSGVYSGPQISWTRIEPFSPEWVEGFSRGEKGCSHARGSYTWRRSGIGSNINNLLNAWVYGIVVEKWIDMAVIIGEKQLKTVECGERSAGVASTGWECLFRPMPHLCTFPSEEAWEKHMLSKRVKKSEVAKSKSIHLDTVRMHPEKIVKSMDGLVVDHMGALAVMSKYIWSSLTPWLQADVDLITRVLVPDTFEQWPYLALHVRRSDKLEQADATIHYIGEYLRAAVAYLESDDSDLSVGDIKGIWLASDDSNVVRRLKEIASDYLPNVATDSIIWASGGENLGPVPTHTEGSGYGDLVHVLADLQRCMSSAVFVGTFSSNIGRLLMLLRTSIGLKPHATISLDQHWRPGRRH